MTPSQTSQPPVSTTGSSLRLGRLLTTWKHVTATLSSAEAHGMERDVVRLKVTQAGLEDRIMALGDAGQHALDVLMDWEASLLHVDGSIGPNQCRICLRVRLTLPADPLPVRHGGGC